MNNSLNLHMGCVGKKYFATATLDGEKIIVKKGSIISSEVKKSPKFKYSKEASNYRNDKSIVNNKFVVCKDINFSSLSAAAQFVCGCSANGNDVWLTDNNEKVKNVRR